jgi:acyl-coenzyme A synthetase/AMP-(fatty) acid ligase
MALRLKPEQTLDTAFLRRVQELNRTLAAHKRLAGLVVTNVEFPRTASQKIKRVLLARELAKAMPRESAMTAL